MACRSKKQHTISALELFYPPRRRPASAQSNRCSSRHAAYPSSPCFSRFSRNVSTSIPRQSETEAESDPRPRWSYTPPAMKAPLPSRLPRREEPWKVNEDPAKLDSFYLQFLGPQGDELLTDETKWLAVTHKSFDHGRRGFNDRLSYLGRRILELQVTLAFLSSSARESLRPPKNAGGQRPFRHAATDGVEILNSDARTYFTQRNQLSHLGKQYGLQDVIRWNPRKPESMILSGYDMVLSQAVLAIVGGVALERGGGEANRIARERIINPLGVRLPKSPV